jgi:spore maturation protein CgeB
VKVLILDTYYPRFLESVYAKSPALAERSYEEQLRHLVSQCFGTSDFYSSHLRELGVDAVDVVPNCAPLQEQWAVEHRMPKPRGDWSPRGIARSVRNRLRGYKPSALTARSAESVALAQTRAFAPDVLYCQDLSFLSPSGLAEARRHARLLVGQIACPLPGEEQLKPFDLILTSFPHFVPRFRAMGIASEYFRIAFEPKVLERVGAVERHRPVTFVGGISSSHGKGTRLLEGIARRVPLEVFGYGAETLDPASELAKRHRGEAWALGMYRALCESKITINRHIDVAEDNANNMRLYEATGCGALLVTDAKKNLGELFEPGVEVVTYRSEEEAAEVVAHYMANDAERARIANAGQQRTLRDHTYTQRMAELVPILERALKGRARA